MAYTLSESTQNYTASSSRAYDVQRFNVRKLLESFWVWLVFTQRESLWVRVDSSAHKHFSSKRGEEWESLEDLWFLQLSPGDVFVEQSKAGKRERHFVHNRIRYSITDVISIFMCFFMISLRVWMETLLENIWCSSFVLLLNRSKLWTLNGFWSICLIV